MGSADWMPRNLDKRVEIIFPLLEDRLKEEAVHILEVELADNVKARILGADGNYSRIDKRGKTLVNSQRVFVEEAAKAVPDIIAEDRGRVFIPAEPM